MRIFIDACIDPRVAALFAEHDVSTAFDLGWHQLADHEVVGRCMGRFDLLLTTDRGFEHEHNLSKLTFGIVIVHVLKNKVEFYRPLRDSIAEAVGRIGPGEVIHVR
ncbi:MAG TPA: DUF5615 family PIN-like protein [Bryobacteraceae bacterium]|nr:DUF5615 family PIN-like protein [Bryobacteraceae bacterium]